MNTIIKRRAFTATALFAVLLGSAACGSETVTNDGGAQPGYESRIYPPASVPPAPLGEKKGPVTADAAERKAAAEKARQDRASTDRWARGSQSDANENKLKRAGHPGPQ